MAEKGTPYMRAHDSIARMERACSNRLDEGRALHAIGRGYWAIYTFGYVAEICLKTAFLHFAGLGRDDDASEYVFGKFPARWARAIGVSREAGSMHDLLFWFEMIVEERNIARKPIDRDFSRECAIHIQHVAMHWRPGMRYHPSVRMGDRTLQVAAATTWIVEHQQWLWS